jgi:hypothetical protein
MQVVERLSAARNSSSDLRLISAGAPHESASPASNLARASARTLRTLALCLRIPQNAVWLCARDSPMHRPMTILAVTLLKSKRSDSDGKLANDQDRLIQIQIP